jgi:hypothetical protein
MSDAHGDLLQPKYVDPSPPADVPRKDLTPQEKIAAFPKLLSEIFVSHRATLSQSTVNPINLDAAYQSVSEEAITRIAAEEERYKSLAEVAESIREHGGITKDEYGKHKAEINRFTRVWLDIQGIAEGYDPHSEDVVAQEVTPDVLARFPDDGRYSNKNIFGNHRLAQPIPGYEPGNGVIRLLDDEGIMWHREYTGDDQLMTRFRIYNQAHRKTLVVKTVDVPVLQRKILDYVEKYQPESVPEKPDLGVSEEAYRRMVDEFNGHYAGIMHVELGSGDASGGSQEYYVIPETEGKDSSKIQPILVVHDNHRNIADAVIQVLPEPMMRGDKNTTVEQGVYPDDTRVTVIYPYRRVSGETVPGEEFSVVDVDREPVSFSYLQKGLKKYLELKLHVTSP